MDRIIYLFGALLMSAGIVVLLGITPEIITQDIMSLMSRQRSLKYCVAKAQGKVKQSRLQTAIMDIKNALIATHSENKFSLLISVSLIGICAGFLLAALLQNLLLIPIFRESAWCCRMHMLMCCSPITTGVFQRNSKLHFRSSQRITFQ